MKGKYLIVRNTYLNEEYFPNGTNYDCPPRGAQAFSGELFRFVKERNNVTTADYELMTSRKNFRKRYKTELKVLCQGSGLSSYISKNDAIESLTRVTKGSGGFGKRFNGIFKIDITKSDGVVDSTPSNNTYNHHTWWAKGHVDEFVPRSKIVRNT